MPVWANWILIGKPLGGQHEAMSTYRKPLARLAGWLRAPQPRSGARGFDPEFDADLRRAHADLAAVRSRFPDHA